MDFIRRYWPGLAIIFVFLIIGLLNYQNYGVSTDEKGQTDIGLISYNYAFNGDDSLHKFDGRDHGAGFELPLIILEKKMGLTDYRDIFLARHIVGHLFFLLCVLSGYFLALRLFRSQWLAVFTLLMLLMNPRLYGHSFFNSKDIPSLATLVVILWFAYLAFEEKKLRHYILLGIACGFAISIRLMNLVVIPPLLFFLLIDVFHPGNRALVRKHIAGMLLLCATTALTLYAFWPTLWEHPVASLIESFQSLSKYGLTGWTFLSGVKYDMANLPWSYIPTWFFITVPEVWLLLGIVGIVFLLAGFFRDPLSYFLPGFNRHLLLYLYCFLAPVVAVIVLKSVLYDDWRHLYFIYPPFILLAAYGLHELSKTRFATVYKGLWALQLIYLIYFIARYHPHEYVYYNHTVSRKKDALAKQYFMDYWNVSGKAAFEWILSHTDDDSIYVNYNFGNSLNKDIIPLDQRKRIILTDDESKMEYYIDRSVDYKYPEEQAIHQITVSNSPITRITKLK